MASEAAVRVLVLTGLGLNCEAETAQGFRMAGAEPEQVPLAELLAGGRELGSYDIVAMIGGFSFGDHLGAGVVYANRLRCRLGDQLERFIVGGGLVIGICNGFQAMARLGLVPGLDGDYGRQRVTLAANERLGYRDAWVRLRVEPATKCVWTRGITEIELPARHGEGRFLAESEAVLERIEGEGQVALRYVDEKGNPTEAWPGNPNGSRGGIAGICDPTGRVFGLMPHPDAYLYGIHHPQWTRKKLRGELRDEGEGVRIFRNGVEEVRRMRGEG